jgi:hypothetical protein
MPVVVTCPDGMRVTYSCSPREAVKCAWYQFKKKRYDTWNYDYRDVVRLPDGRYAYQGFIAQVVEGIVPSTSSMHVCPDGRMSE